MPVISAAGVNNVGNRTAAAAKFRGVRVGLDDHFTDGFKILRLNGLTLNSVIVIVETIDQEVVGTGPKSVHREARAVRKIVTVCDADNSRLGKHQGDRIE